MVAVAISDSSAAALRNAGQAAAIHRILSAAAIEIGSHTERVVRHAPCPVLIV